MRTRPTNPLRSRYIPVAGIFRSFLNSNTNLHFLLGHHAFSEAPLRHCGSWCHRRFWYVLLELTSGASTNEYCPTIGATTCTKDVKITQPTPSIDCKVIDANLIIDKSVAGEVVITGPEEITGDVVVKDAPKIISLSSSSITTIGGKLELDSLEALQTLQMDSLTDVGELSFITLPRLGTLVFGTKGVTKISSIRISDTYLSDLSGLSVASVDTFQIDNNRKITSFNSDLVNVTKQLLIFDNGNNMDITMDKLETVAEVQISNAKNFKVSALERVTKSLKFTSNPELKSLSFPNLTKVDETVSFVDMNKLTNISFPVLETIGGGLAIENNTKLLAIDDLPKLKTVYGGISLRGNFEK